MTLDLAYSYCTGLSKEEIIAIDKQVCRNRELVYIFVTKLPLNTKHKAKRVIIVSALGVALWFSNVEPYEAMGLSILPAPVVRVEPSYEDTFELRTPKIIARTNNRIAYKSNRETIKNNDYSTRQIDPITFSDWEGDNRFMKSRELKKTVCAHGVEAGVVSPEDMIPCSVQSDPTKYKRKECARITDEGIEKLIDKILYLGTSTKPGMGKFEIPMPYYDSEMAIGYLDVTTVDCAFFHKDVKYWSYKKYRRRDILKLIADAQPSFKWASNNSSPRSEL